MTCKEMLRQGRAVALSTKGASMWPLIRADETTVVVEPTYEPLLRGDLPLYLRGDGKYVIHRIVGVKKNSYWTLGDNSYSVEYVSKKQILGVVTQIHRGNKCICVTDKRYKAYVWLWMRLIPLRIAAHKAWKGRKKIKIKQNH